MRFFRRPRPGLETRSIDRFDEEFQDAIAQSCIGGELSRERREIVGPMLPLLPADIERAIIHKVTDEEPLSFNGFRRDQRFFDLPGGMMGWHAMTKGDFFLRHFPGGHEFVKPCEVEVTVNKKTL